MTPYAPPNSQVGTTTEPGSSVTAVLVGAAVGNGTCYAVLLIFGNIFMWILTGQGVPSHELYGHIYQSNAYIVFAHAVGLMCCIPGGYWSARLGPEKPYFNSSFAACIVALVTFAAYLVPYALPIPFWSRVISVVAPFAGFLLGAHLWLRRVINR
jgi:hypothetical protein